MKKAFQVMVAAASTSFFISCDEPAPGERGSGIDTTRVIVDTPATADVVVPVDTASTANADSSAMSVDTMAAVPEPTPLSTTAEAYD